MDGGCRSGAGSLNSDRPSASARARPQLKLLRNVGDNGAGSRCRDNCYEPAATFVPAWLRETTPTDVDLDSKRLAVGKLRRYQGPPIRQRLIVIEAQSAPRDVFSHDRDRGTLQRRMELVQRHQTEEQRQFHAFGGTPLESHRGMQANQQPVYLSGKHVAVCSERGMCVNHEQRLFRERWMRRRLEPRFYCRASPSTDRSGRISIERRAAARSNGRVPFHNSAAADE